MVFQGYFLLNATLCLFYSGCDAQSADNSLKEKVNWLKEHNSPEENVKQAMKETVFIREAFIKGDKKNNIRSILTEYPRLLDPGMVIISTIFVQSFVNVFKTTQSCKLPILQICIHSL